MEFETNNLMENHDLYVTSQEGIECTKTKECLSSYCPIYMPATHQVRKLETTVKP